MVGFRLAVRSEAEDVVRLREQCVAQPLRHGTEQLQKVLALRALALEEQLARLAVAEQDLSDLVQEQNGDRYRVQHRFEQRCAGWCPAVL
jgi:hypothetical protein